MKTVVLRGELGKKFGRFHSFDLTTPAEAIRALCANFEGFQRELCEAGERGVGYMVQIGRDAMQSLDDIDNPTGRREEISITPVLQGAGGGGGLGSIFAGFALVAAAIVLGPVGFIFSGFGAGAIGASAAAATGLVGAGLVLSGTATLLSPSLSDSPRVGGSSLSRANAQNSFAAEFNEVPDNRGSYVFNGAVNITAQGNPVPLLYGRMKVGSVVVSAGLSVEDI